MNSSVSKILKTTAKVYGVLGFISGIGFAILFPSHNSYGLQRFNFLLLLSIWAGVFLSALFIYAFGEVLSVLSQINQNLTQNNEQNALLLNKIEAVNFSPKTEPDATPSAAEVTEPTPTTNTVPQAEKKDIQYKESTTRQARLISVDGKDTFECSLCGKKHRGSREKCWNCHATFI